MKEKRAYYEQATSWALDTQALASRSQRVAWTLAGVAAAVALFEAVALAMLTPLKTVQTVTLLVDKQTGYVQAIDPLTPRRLLADDALTNSYLAQYVMAREGFDRATVAGDYRKVALWSVGRARSSYLALMPATNPASPFQRMPAGSTIEATVKSVSRLGKGLALVRFDTVRVDRTAQRSANQPWVAVTRFRYVDAPMRLEDRLVNPLGFQVTGYRRDPEAPPPPPPPPPSSSAGALAPVVPAPTTTTLETSRSIVRPEPIPVPRPTSAPRTPFASTTAFRQRTSLPERREVPLNRLPLGSPVSPSNPSFPVQPTPVQPAGGSR